jgi:hypothetical protein
MPIGSFVGTLSSAAHVFSSYSYELTDGNNSSDNSSFTISNDSLLTNTVFEVSTFNNKEIRVKTTDDRGNPFEKSFFLNIIENTGSPVHQLTKENFIISPNPVSDKLYIKGLQAHSYRIVDITGIPVLQGNLRSNTIDLKSLINGVYILYLIDKSGNSTLVKFIKEHK